MTLREKTIKFNIGNKTIGGSNDILIQTMANIKQQEKPPFLITREVSWPKVQQWVIHYKIHWSFYFYGTHEF